MPLCKKLTCFITLVLFTALLPVGVQGETGVILTLDQAISLTMEFHPAIKAFEAGSAARESVIEQAGYYPNPELEIGTENLGFNEAEVTVNQLIELGGKRQVRIDLATSERDLYSLEAEMAGLNLVEAVTRRYFDVLQAQSRLHLLDETLGLTENIRQTVVKHIEAGAMAAVEETRVQLDITRISIERHGVEAALKSKKQALAILWGGSENDFHAIEVLSEKEVALPNLDDLNGCLSRNPIMKSQAEHLHRRALELVREQAAQTPDITVGAGFLRNNELDENAFVLSVALPLRLFDRNEGNVARARAELQLEQKNSQAVELRLRAELSELYTELKSLQYQAKRLKIEALPTAEAMLAEIDGLFDRGKMNLLDLFDVRRIVIDLRSSLLETRISFMITKAGIERLIGISLETVSTCGGTSHDK